MTNLQIVTKMHVAIRDRGRDTATALRAVVMVWFYRFKLPPQNKINLISQLLPLKTNYDVQR